MRVSTSWSTVVLLLAFQQMGCTEDVRFDPAGCDVQVRGRWTIDGQPPTAETCAPFQDDPKKNIALVELAIINDEEDQFWSEDELLLPCAPCEPDDTNCDPEDPGFYYLDSQANPRDRCGGSGEVLKDRLGPYKYRWRAITDLNFIVDCSPILVQEIEPLDGGPELVLELPTVNFVTTEGGDLCPDTN